MTRASPRRFTNADALAGWLVEAIGKRITIGVPLGLGKPVPIVDALYARAEEDSSLSLRILTALTLAPPVPGSELEERLVGPWMTRVFAGYRPPRYVQAQREDRLPPNVEVVEFYLTPGSLLDSPAAQGGHLSANYSQVAAMAADIGVDVIAQLVADGPEGPSLSCNPDITLDLLDIAGADGETPLLVGQLHPELPYFGHEAALPESRFDALLEAEESFSLPSVPELPIGDAAHAIGLRASGLIADGGTLQLGIGDRSNALAHALVLRQTQNAAYRRLLDELGDGAAYGEIGGVEPFVEGLHGVTEMLVEGYLHLIDAGVISRPDAEGALVRAGFFLGPRRLLSRLRQMSPAERERIRMMPISFVNDVHHDFAAKAAQRRLGRFVNSGMIATIDGAVASDGLDDGRVVSGVGGQFDFVSMAHALPGGRSILLVPSVREADGDVTSNIRARYAHCTVPRHFRDLVVTEYGVADLRGRTDREVAARMIAVADARFQDELVAAARDAHKLPPDYRVPDRARCNTPERVRDALKAAKADGLLPEFPFGTELTSTERGLLRALSLLRAGPGFDGADLKNATRVPPEAEPFLRRLRLAAPKTLAERVMRHAVAYALSAAGVVPEGERKTD